MGRGAPPGIEQAMTVAHHAASARARLRRITALPLVRHLSALSAAEVVVRVLGLSVTVVVSRLLGPGALGQLAFAQAFIAYFLVASDAGLTTLALRDVVRAPETLART